MENNTNEQQSEQQNERPAANSNRLNKRAIIFTVAIFFIVIAGMFLFAFMQQDEGSNDATVDTNEQTEDDRYANITRIDAKHFYEDGVHTLVGEVQMPTPCDLLEATANVAESMPEQITIEFSVVNNAEFCAQVITSQRFKVSASASPEASIRAQFEGRDVILNLLEPELGETPEEFELFLKG